MHPRAYTHAYTHGHANAHAQVTFGEFEREAEPEVEGDAAGAGGDVEGDAGEERVMPYKRFPSAAYAIVVVRTRIKGGGDGNDGEICVAAVVGDHCRRALTPSL